MNLLREYIRKSLILERKTPVSPPRRQSLSSLGIPENYNDIIEKQYPAHAIPNDQWEPGSIGWVMELESLEDAYEKRNREILGDERVEIAKTATGAGKGLGGAIGATSLIGVGLLIDALGAGGLASFLIKAWGAKGVFLSLGHEALKAGGWSDQARREFKEKIKWDPKLLPSIDDVEEERYENEYMDYVLDIMKNSPHTSGHTIEDINDFYLRTSESSLLQPTGKTIDVITPSDKESMRVSSKLRGQDSKESQRLRNSLNSFAKNEASLKYTINKILQEDAKDLKKIRKYVRFLIEQSEIPKVIFMAGGPGSGKSTVIKRLNLSSRLEVINPDDQYEETMRAEGIPADRAKLLDEYKPLKDQYTAAQEAGDEATVMELEPEYLRLRSLLSRNMVLFNQARKGAKQAQTEHIAAGEEFLVDGTGGNYNEIARQAEKLKSAGYDIAMIFINVPMETSIARDHSRGESGGRRLGAKTVERSWSAVDANKPLYEELFGEDFFYVDASEEAFETSIDEIADKVQRFLQ
tara:strand:+ start:1807 stop:3375 length:1569 start_codon:yes stop_codon:yes gene_type:complete